MNEKFLRLVFVLVGIAALCGFGWKMYDFYIHRMEFQQRVDIAAIRAGFETKDPSQTLGTHLHKYADYAVLQELNITGYVAPPPKPENPTVVTVKPILEARDVEVPLIQSPNAAWIQARGEQPVDDQAIGDFYAVGERFELSGKVGLDLRLKSVQPGWVEIELIESGEILKVYALTYEVDPTSVFANLEGPTPGDGGREVGLGTTLEAPEYSRELEEPNSYAVGKKDVAALEAMSQEEVLASLPHSVHRDQMSNEVIGLRIKSVPANSIFERLGLRADDIVLDVNGEPATDRDQLYAAMKQLNTDTLKVRIERLGGERTLTYRLPH